MIVKNWNITISIEPEEKARIAYQVALTGKSLGIYVKELILDAVKEKEVVQGHVITGTIGKSRLRPPLIISDK